MTVKTPCPVVDDVKAQGEPLTCADPRLHVCLHNWKAASLFMGMETWWGFGCGLEKLCIGYICILCLGIGLSIHGVMLGTSDRELS